MTRCIDTPKELITSGLDMANLYDFKLKSTGSSFTIPAVAAVLELNDKARTCITGNMHSIALKIKKAELKTLKHFSPSPTFD